MQIVCATERRRRRHRQWKCVPKCGVNWKLNFIEFVCWTSQPWHFTSVWAHLRWFNSNAHRHRRCHCSTNGRTTAHHAIARATKTQSKINKLQEKTKEKRNGFKRCKWIWYVQNKQLNGRREKKSAENWCLRLFKSLKELKIKSKNKWWKDKSFNVFNFSVGKVNKLYRIRFACVWSAAVATSNVQNGPNHWRSCYQRQQCRRQSIGKHFLCEFNLLVFGWRKSDLSHRLFCIVLCVSMLLILACLRNFRSAFWVIGHQLIRIAFRSHAR